MTTLKLIPLDDAVAFPGMPVTIPAEVGGDSRVVLIPRRGAGYAKVGVVAEVSERAALDGTWPRSTRSTDAYPARPMPTPTAASASTSTSATTSRRRRA
jgi:hypothetical protein